MNVRIVTDSTADILPEQAETLGVTVVPLTLFFEDEAYLDYIDIDSTSFYNKLAESKTLPRSSQPSPAKFQEAFTRLIEEGAEGIISIHLSAQLSGTYQSACTARDSMPENTRHIPIEVIDSQTISAGMHFGIQKAIEGVQQGLSIEEIKAQLADQFARTRLLAILDTLEFVKRGGRIGGAKALLGNMLSVKPIIALRDGAVIPVEQPRTRSKAFARTAQLAAEAGPFEYISIVESNDEVGEQFSKVLQEAIHREVPRYKLGPVIGTHTGPGIVGTFFVVTDNK